MPESASFSIVVQFKAFSDTYAGIARFENLIENIDHHCCFLRSRQRRRCGIASQDWQEGIDLPFEESYAVLKKETSAHGVCRMCEFAYSLSPSPSPNSVQLPQKPAEPATEPDDNAPQATVAHSRDLDTHEHQYRYYKV